MGQAELTCYAELCESPPRAPLQGRAHLARACRTAIHRAAARRTNSYRRQRRRTADGPSGRSRSGRVSQLQSASITDQALDLETVKNLSDCVVQSATLACVRERARMCVCVCVVPPARACQPPSSESIKCPAALLSGGTVGPADANEPTLFSTL